MAWNVTVTDVEHVRVGPLMAEVSIEEAKNQVVCGINQGMCILAFPRTRQVVGSKVHYTCLFGLKCFTAFKTC